MAAKFKMATKTRFSYEAKKTLVRHIEYGRHLEFLREKIYIKAI
jgi:hypothetical protein